MKIFLTIFSILCVTFTCFAQDLTNVSTSGLFHKTITATNIQHLNLDVDGNVNIKSTKGSRILVEVNIKIGVPNKNLLDYLIKSGRYDLVVERKENLGEMVVSSKKTNNILMVKGKECKEELEYTIFVPEQIQLVNGETASTVGR
ncbi:MAG: hypothetical protein MK212_06310 [Saprospiraceae bacterium]|nr:hypothetical protein [Saprospiraceae bacterium]